MKSVLEEYGMIIVIVAIILIFLAFTSPLGKAITENITQTVQDFLTKANGFWKQPAAAALMMF